MYSQKIDDYIKCHESGYQAKYCYHSCDRLNETTFKFHYYVRDPQLLQLNIFLEIDLSDEIVVKGMEEVHEQEQSALACDALSHIKGYMERSQSISPSQMEKFVAQPEITDSLTPQDLINVLNYIEYHQGKNPDSVYQFYTIFLPYLEYHLNKKDYREAMEACQLLFEEILYEVFWYGFNIKYLDQEHLMHQAYIRSVFNLIHQHFEEIYQEAEDLLFAILTKTFEYWRFAFAIYTSLENLVTDYPKRMSILLSKMKN